MAEVAPKLPEWVQRLHPRRILGRVRREILGQQDMDYISKTSQALIRQGLIREPLTVKELFAITDIHVHDGSGISVGNLRDLAPDYELLGLRSYGFFGQLPYGLPEKYRISEHELIAAGALNGVHVGRDLDGFSLRALDASASSILPMGRTHALWSGGTGGAMDRSSPTSKALRPSRLQGVL